MKTLFLTCLALLYVASPSAFSGPPPARTTDSYSDQIIDRAYLPKDAREQIAALHAGMTRAELEKHFSRDGGLSQPFNHRYILRGVAVSGTPVMVLIDFQPAGMPDSVYSDPNLRRAIDWTRAHGGFNNPNDVIRRISKPFLSYVSED